VLGSIVRVRRSLRLRTRPDSGPSRRPRNSRDRSRISACAHQSVCSAFLLSVPCGLSNATQRRSRTMAQTQVDGTGAAKLDDQREKVVPTPRQRSCRLAPRYRAAVGARRNWWGCRSERVWHDWLGVVRVGQGCRKRDRALYRLDCKGGPAPA
jgi:hypothetical protein